MSEDDILLAGGDGTGDGILLPRVERPRKRRRLMDHQGSCGVFMAWVIGESGEGHDLEHQLVGFMSCAWSIVAASDEASVAHATAPQVYGKGVLATTWGFIQYRCSIMHELDEYVQLDGSISKADMQEPTFPSHLFQSVRHNSLASGSSTVEATLSDLDRSITIVFNCSMYDVFCVVILLLICFAQFV